MQNTQMQKEKTMSTDSQPIEIETSIKDDNVLGLIDGVVQFETQESRS